MVHPAEPPHVNAGSTYVAVFYAAASGAQPTPGTSNVTGHGSHGALQLQMLSGATGKDTTAETKAISKAGEGEYMGKATGEVVS